MITFEDKRYPKLLKEIDKEAPKQLYYKGNWPEDSSIFKNCLAVVGSRRMTSYGKRVVEQIVTEIAAAGITIVSGFMYGIDAAAHKVALQAGGRTVAVMPCGIDLIHPEYQQNLYNEILNNNGLIISEYQKDTQPALWTYPRRNRIVAGLCNAVLIIEAGEKSGSLITANWAKKFKRKIFAIPGPITSLVSKGTLQLIKDGTAEMVISSKNILDYYSVAGFNPATTSQKIQGSHLEQQIIKYLQGEPLGIDELSRLLKISVSELGTTLSIMQLQGTISQDGSKYYLVN